MLSEGRRLLLTFTLALLAHGGLAIGSTRSGTTAQREPQVAATEPSAGVEVVVERDPAAPMAAPALGKDSGYVGGARSAVAPKRHTSPPPRPARASEVKDAASAGAAVPESVAPSFAGGFTTSRGSSADFVGDPNAADALLYGDGTGGGGDMITPPRLGGYVAWSCPWPDEGSQLDHADVRVTVDVSAGGDPVRARLVDDPGAGFGRNAIACALKSHYIPGRDRRGHPVAGRTRPFRVEFDRALRTLR